MSKVVFHVDVNSAFLSWEAVHRLKRYGTQQDLRLLPSAVGGDIALRRGIILAKSLPAKAYGIHTGETIRDALIKCPSLLLVPPNYSLYETASDAMMELLRTYSPCVEPYSIDEAFLDMSGMETLLGDPVTAANRIRTHIRDTLGFTVNIGVADNKLLAKMASDFRKPDLVHTLFSSEIPEKLWPLPVSELLFVGRATAKKLFSLGIKTIGALAQTDPRLLRKWLHKQGELLWGFANGIDRSAVRAEAAPNKGYGNSTTIPFDVTDAAAAKTVLLSLAETVAARLRREQVFIGVLAVGIRSSDLSYASHQTVLETPTNLTQEIYQVSCRLFDQLWDHTPIRHLGIHTSRPETETVFRQETLFCNTDYERLARLDAAVDQIRARYGNDAVKRAVFAQKTENGRPVIDHMSGGISKEKQTVDYNALLQ